GDHLAVAIKVENLVDVSFRDQQFVANDQQAERIAKTVPIRQVLSRRVEDLNPPIAAIGNVDPVFAVDGQTMRRGELAGALPFAPPLGEEAAVGGQLDDPSIAAVGNVDVPV